MANKDLKDVVADAADKVKQAGRDLVESVTDEEQREKAKQTAREVESTVESMLGDLGEEAVKILESEEVERAVDRMGSALKRFARKLREGREQRERPAAEE